MSAFTPGIAAEDATTEFLARIDEHTQTTVYVVQRSVSKSGMTRRLSLFIVSGREVVNVTWHVAAILGQKVSNDDQFTITVRGTGMDMHWYTVYRLERAIFGTDVEQGSKLRSETL